MPTKPPTFRAPGWKPAAKRKQVQDPFYQSPLWKRLRAACLARDGYQCTMADCPTPDRGRSGVLIADHIKPRREGGADELWNLRTLCPFCDGRRHGRRPRLRPGGQSISLPEPFLGEGSAGMRL
jgi:5-methylcytosine-specific restriction endonuclease McrA